MQLFNFLKWKIEIDSDFQPCRKVEYGHPKLIK